jgi:hypothetical protein
MLPVRLATQMASCCHSTQKLRYTCRLAPYPGRHCPAWRPPVPTPVLESRDAALDSPGWAAHYTKQIIGIGNFPNFSCWCEVVLISIGIRIKRLYGMEQRIHQNNRPKYRSNHSVFLTGTGMFSDETSIHKKVIVFHSNFNIKRIKMQFSMKIDKIDFSLKNQCRGPARFWCGSRSGLVGRKMMRLWLAPDSFADGWPLNWMRLPLLSRENDATPGGPGSACVQHCQKVH